MGIIFDPAILFISEDDWLNEDKRDVFLEHLLNNLTHINDYNISLIYWTNELEEFLWSHPQLPPWRLDRDWKLKIVPTLYKLFSNRIILLDDFGNTIPCKVQPMLSCSYNEPKVLDYFLCLVHFLIGKKEQLYFCVGLENQLTSGEKYTFHSYKPTRQLEPTLINTANDWFLHINLVENYWPTTCSSNEIEKFRTAIKITSKIHLSADTDNFRYSYDFDKKFIENISKEQKYRKMILLSIVKRLFLSQKEASKDSGLNDEPLKGQKSQAKVRRFRVTKEIRIHYEYSEKSKILFLAYYGLGQHDRGL